MLRHDMRQRPAAAATSSLSATAVSPRNRFYVCIATVPGREPLLPVVVQSFLKQYRVPDRVLVLVPRVFAMRKGPSSNPLRGEVDLSRLPRHPRVEARECDRDYGPGTKLLCALPRVLQLEPASSGSGTPDLGVAWLVLADDDRIYRPWLLEQLDRTILEGSASMPYGYAAAYSFQTQDIWFVRPRQGRCFAPCKCPQGPGRCTGRQYIGARAMLAWRSVRLPSDTPPTLTLGMGADTFAIPLRLLGWAPQFFSCAVGYDRLIALHDDFWISAFLRLQHNLTVERAYPPAGENSTRVDFKRRRSKAKRTRDGQLALSSANETVAVRAACAEHFEDLRRCVGVTS